MPRPKTNSDQLHGTLDLLVLRVLRSGAQHGYAITQRLKTLSDDVLQVEEGSLYPALYRMEQRGWIASEWAITERNRRARYYSLTPTGRRQVEAERASWSRLSGAVNLVIAGTE
ncbi:MAG: PadR family transcriptional regulator [Vicinamibacterales bacterium]